MHDPRARLRYAARAVIAGGDCRGDCRRRLQGTTSSKKVACTPRLLTRIGPMRSRFYRLLPPYLGTKRQLVQLGSGFAPGWVVFLKDGGEALAVRRFTQMGHFVDDDVLK